MFPTLKQTKLFESHKKFMHKTTFSITKKKTQNTRKKRKINSNSVKAWIFWHKEAGEKNRRNRYKKKSSNCFAISRKRNPPLPNESFHILIVLLLFFFCEFRRLAGGRRTLKEINWDQFLIWLKRAPPLEIHESVIFDAF